MPVLEIRDRQVWPLGTITLALLVLGMLALMVQSGLLGFWLESGEYGHGPVVLLLLGYLIYRKRDSLSPGGGRVDWLLWGAAGLPLLVYLTGAAAGISQLQIYAVWLFAVALGFALGRVALLRVLAVPLIIAFMTIPLHSGLELALTAQLQLLSSQLGVWFIRLLGGVAYLQGNVIDMGNIKLLVDEACSGLRYLYPLMGLGAVAAYLFQAPVWARWLLFLATVPVTIFMNSFRIAVTGVLVENQGDAHTQGFLHFFEGWVVFAVALMVMILIAWALLRLQGDRRELVSAFSLDPPMPRGQSGEVVPGTRPRGSPTPEREPGRRQRQAVLVVTAAILLAVTAAPAVAFRTEHHPDRQSLSDFPLRLGDWVSHEQRLPLIIERVAGASEYYYSDFSSAGGEGVNLYLSYYASQRDGKIPHSPLVCIPGDGWAIVSVDAVSVKDSAGASLEVNRLVTTKGDRTVLAYYWLKQGDKTYRRELVARLGLIRSAMLERRTDGALIRLVAELAPGETLKDVDRRLAGFAAELTKVLSKFVPD